MHPKHPQTFGFISPPTSFFLQRTQIHLLVIQLYRHTHIYIYMPTPLYIHCMSLLLIYPDSQDPSSWQPLDSICNLDQAICRWGPKWNGAIIFEKGPGEG